MKPRPARHVRAERVHEPEREVGATGGGQHAGQDDGAVAHRVDVDADGVCGARVLADGSDSKADRRLEDDDPRHEDEQDREPDHEVELAEDVVEERADHGDVAEERELDVRDRREVGGRPLRAVELEVEVARQTEREEVDRRAADDLVRAERDRRRTRAAAPSGRRRATPMASPRGHAPVMSAPQTAKNAPVSIIPSSPMFTTPERSENRPPIDAKTSGVA